MGAVFVFKSLKKQKKTEENFSLLSTQGGT